MYLYVFFAIALTSLYVTYLNILPNSVTAPIL
nr:MAG TPA: hypothetical protein [Caudoviricetes sp.]DAK89785.1 MAG TPA: hypothetical protein [Caudoviricetes sp.]